MNIFKTKVKVKKVIISLTLLPLLTSCAVYKSSFASDPAKGAGNTSMDNVYRMIESGEIERFNEERENCRGKRCKKNQGDEIVLQKPVLRYVPTHFKDQNRR